MIPILTSDSYRGFSNDIHDFGPGGTQPLFVGRIIWPGQTHASDVVIKIYRPDTCGIANEVIGYVANKVRRIAQPLNAAILLLEANHLIGVHDSIEKYVDQRSGLIATWVTSLEQNTKPFSYIRRLPTFSAKQAKVFYKSLFCKSLSSVDHVTGNNDRHSGNFLYIDDLKYLAIDQGCVGGGLYWHTTWPDNRAKNQLLEITHTEFSGSELSSWTAEAILEHERTQSIWDNLKAEIECNLKNLLDDETCDTIVKYMDARITGSTYTESCGKLI
jgi:hypothetical protein